MFLLAVVQADVHADSADQAYDSEVSAYFRYDDSPPPPTRLRLRVFTAACNVTVCQRALTS